MKTDEKKLIVIAGPTAVGKTSFAIAIAQYLKAQIINADSRQVYKELNIGVARPSTDELEKITHHFIASHSIHNPLNAGDYAIQALVKINDLFKSANYIVLCGGSGLYINGLINGFDNLPEANHILRNELHLDYQKYGLSYLQNIIAEKDPEYYSIVDIHNPQRLMRAIEVMKATGKKYSELRQNANHKLPYKVIYTALELDRPTLVKRIDDRVETMLTAGLIEEVEQLLPFKNLTPLQTVGYQELFDYLEGKYSKAEAIELIKIHTRQYAKRQMTWFRKQEIIWFKNDEQLTTNSYIDKILKL